MKPQNLRIVCGTDFSTHAAEAGDVAAAIARKLDEIVVLVHVAESEAQFGRVQPSLDAEAGRLRTAGAIVKEHLLAGSPYEAIVEHARTGSARLIVVSSVGRIAPSRFLVGSTAERIAESSPVPTLVVRGGNALVAWARQARPLKVCVGCDFSSTADAALRWTRELGQIGPCEITAVHIWWPPEQGDKHAPLAKASEVQQQMAAELKKRLGELMPEVEVRTRIEPCWGRADAALLAVAEQEGADLVVVGTHQRRGLSRFWLGSVSRGVLHSAHTSVAVIPPDDGAAGSPRPETAS